MAFADTFKALSDPARRDILEMLKNKPLSAGEIAKQFDMTQATVSYHLKVLKKADLIRENRKKNFIYYELNLTVLEELMMWLSDLKNKEIRRKVSMKDNNTDYQNDNSCNNSNISLSMAVHRLSLHCYQLL